MSTIITTITRARRFSPAAAGRWLAAGLAVALVAAGVQAVAAGPALAAVSAGAASAGPGPAPVSNAFAMGGGIGGSIDQRTGAFQAQVPLLSIADRAGQGLSLALTYEQSLAVQGAAGDRYGLGAGWTLGVPWVDTAGGVHVYPASGGSYAYDAGSPTGLALYPLRDLAFARQSGTLPDGRAYAYQLTYLGGQTTDYFDATGNLIEQADLFGNTIGLTWGQSGTQWRPLTVTDNYGQVTRFDYGTPGQIKVISPVNAEKITATTTLAFYAGYLQTVTDPLNQKTILGYSQVGALPAQLLSSVTSPAGEHTSVTYTQLPYEPGVVEASDVKVTNPEGALVLAERHFTLDPADDTGQHNYTGYPLYNTKGPNALFASGDFGYRYTTELSDGTSAVEATYNSLALLVSQKVLTTGSNGVTRTSQTQAYGYPAVTSVASLPANYAKPTSVAVTYGDPSFKPNRTVTTSSAYNNQGLQTSSTNAAGTTTTTSYNSYGLPATQTVTANGGAASITTDTFTDGGKEVQTASTATGASAAAATARTVATYSYNGFGQVSGESLTWAPGAKPAGDSGGPDLMDTTLKISTDTAAHTQTDVLTTAAGTPQTASTTTVSDLVTGNVLSQSAPGNAPGSNLVTSYTYDALGRQLTMTAPGNQTTTTKYTSPTVTTVTAPSGLQTQTTTDVIGRTLTVTDNVSGQKLLPKDPTARTLESDTYNPYGTKMTTTTPAGTTTTTFDPLGRPVSVVQPGGITQAESYNDVANTTTVSVVPAGAALTDPASVTTNGFNDLGQAVSSSASYPDGTPSAPAAETYDGLGRVASYTSGNLTATPDYSGAGGLQDGTTLTPGDTGEFPGQAAQAATGNTMNGALTAKSLTGQTKAAGTTYTYNAAGQVATATTADHAVTSYTYTPAGQVATVTQPSGTVTTYTYDPVTGRLSQVQVKAADGTTQDTAYAYDPATGQVKSVYDPAHPSDAVSYDYDADGHVTAVHYPDGTSTQASYDDNGELATTTDTTGAVTSYTYNPNAGKTGTCGPAVTDLCAAVQARGSTTLASVNYSYDPMNRVHTITRGNGLTTTITYTDASQVKTETTTAADGSLLRTDAYTYDSHGNVATHTITTALPAPAAPGQAAARAATATTTTTTAKYGYDAYNRLISSATYPGATATGTPTTTTSYTLDEAGNVTGQDTTTGSTTTHVVNTITPGGELTSQATGAAAASQKFDTDGNVTTDLAGDTYTYDPDGEQASVTTPAGITTKYAYWPDGTRRTATTTAGAVAHTITYHYATDGKIANETYAGAAAGATGPATVTASYLLAVNREARTLDNDGTAQTTGAGTGYDLTDAHGSVTAMIDATGQVTASYAYGDYGQAQGANPALLATPAATPAGNAAVNPFSYDDAYTNPDTGTQYLPARTYDPAQGRFLSADAADQFNRYQAFDTNPIVNTDPTGQWALPQIITDAFAALVFAATVVASAGAAIPVFAAAAAGEVIADAAVTATVLNTVAAVTNLGAAATSATLAANDAAELTGNGFLTSDQKDQLNAATFALGTIGGFTSAAPGIIDAVPGEAAAAESTSAADQATAAAAPGQPPPLPAWPPHPAMPDYAPPPVPSADDLFTGAQQTLDRGPTIDDLFNADDGMQDQVPQVSDPADLPGALSTTPAAPQPLDQATAEFTAAQQQAGITQDMQPATQPFAQAADVPGGPADTSVATVPESTDPAVATTNAAAGPSPLPDVAATATQATLDSNAPQATPDSQANPLGENVPQPSIGVTSPQLLETGGIDTPFGGLTWTITEEGF